MPKNSPLRFPRAAALVLVPVLGWAAVRFLAARSTPPAPLGLHNGRLSECPGSPNCVQSEAPDPSSFIEPLRPSLPLDEAWARLESTLAQLPRTRVLRSESNYIHAVFTSAVFGFPDDVEFRRSDSDRLIHVRSASRLGYSDLGANRRRVESLRRRLGW